MTAFSKDEIYTATEVVRNFSSVLTKISKAELKRAVIVKNNKFEAVLLNMSEYERLQEAVSVLEAIYTAKKRENGGE
ncbi:MULTISPECIES: type II toxin-antitoxin system Phd/YefM family antitoxin [Campylobacter]|uniref:type II toxin-antitoxin system Phd/YefM family antitoxin n=1 Tax=Campylobacter TaxID=194 RepID=UPI00147052AA|nr:MULTISPECIES: type II toxin-antitoxin system Phd/YefM family antitoxin [Campylobacter]MBN7289019.1 type II toxin-antitoxin system Phd/YefM family antitoxin [Campylobacter curvus]MDU6828276.1 type II toxin-antitoxin system Phd/YefM family antitoxin [Campylobacter sp.]